MAGIHFNPELIGYNGQGAFRFWCQKVLPLVYDDSLSYYELLCKVVKYLNNTNEDVKLLGNSYLKLVEFVNGYFDNLDVTSEVNQKLDEMVESGELDDVIAAGVSAAAMQATEQQLPGVVAEQIDAVVAEQIDGSVAGQIDEAVDSAVADKIDDAVESQIGGAVAGQIDGTVAEQIGPAVLEQSSGLAAPAVTEWLEQNVVPQGSAVVVDESLSVQGAAADALSTGTGIRALENEFVWDNSSVEFEVGNINRNTGETETGASIRTVGFIENATEVKCNNGYVLEAYAYNKNTNAFVGGYRGGSFTIGESGQDTVIGLPNYYKYKIVLTRTSGTSTNPMTVAEKENGYFLIGTDTTLSLSNKAADAKAVGDAIGELNSALTDVKSYFNDSVEKVDFRTMENVVELLGYNMGKANKTDLLANPLSGYNTYYLYPNEDFYLYFDSDDINGINFVNLATVENAGAVQQDGTRYKITGTNPTNYRKTDNNLPTVENPLHLTVGMAFSITETASTGTFYIRKSSGNVELNSSVELGETQIQQVKNSIGSKKCALKYISGAGVDASTERVEIYIPTVDGFVRYDFLHSVSTSNPHNTDVWHVGYAYHTTENKTEDYTLTTQGAWECATKLTGDGQNFAGGYAHGNEVSTDIIFMIDGAIVNITQITSLREFEELVIFQNSNLYNPLDETTIFAVHGTEHVFNLEGLTIKQSVKFSIATSVSAMYMAMLPMAKAISDNIIPNNSFVPLSTSNAIRIYDTDEVSIYKSTGKNKAVFSVPVWEYLTNNYTFLCVDNGGIEYNKCYFVNTLSNVSVAQNKLMKSVTKYNFIVGN